MTQNLIGYPERPTQLICQHEREDVTYQGWQASLAGMQSFYVAGINAELGSAAFPDVKSVHKEWPRAFELLKQLGWLQLNLKWTEKIAYQQFLRAQNGEALLFTKAASIILTFAVAGRKLSPDYRVQQKLRIVPACYYIQGFDERKLGNLRRSEPSFVKDALEAMKQSTETLLQDMAKGYCVTKSTAEKLRTFIIDRFPDEVIGNISARQMSRSGGFTTRNASSSELVEL